MLAKAIDIPTEQNTPKDPSATRGNRRSILELNTILWKKRALPLRIAISAFPHIKLTELAAKKSR